MERRTGFALDVVPASVLKLKRAQKNLTSVDRNLKPATAGDISVLLPLGQNGQLEQGHREQAVHLAMLIAQETGREVKIFVQPESVGNRNDAG